MGTIAIIALILCVVALVAVAIETVRASAMTLTQFAVVCVSVALLLTLIPK